jgi:hypothetical protein
MTVFNGLGRHHFVMDTIDRLLQTDEQGSALKLQLISKNPA